MTHPSDERIGSIIARSSASGVSAQPGPWTSASNSTNGTSSLRASSRPKVVFPLPLALAITATLRTTKQFSQRLPLRRGCRRARGARRRGPSVRSRRERCADVVGADRRAVVRRDEDLTRGEIHDRRARQLERLAGGYIDHVAVRPDEEQV